MKYEDILMHHITWQELIFSKVCITNEVFDKWWEIYSRATKNIFKMQIITAHTLIHSTDRIVF